MTYSCSVILAGGAWGGGRHAPQRSENSAALGKSITTLGICVDECAPTFCNAVSNENNMKNIEITNGFIFKKMLHSLLSGCQ